MNNKPNNKVRKRNRGFSLVELIIVIAIMAILAGVLAPQFIKYIGNSKKSSDIQNAQMIANAISAQLSQDGVDGTSTIKVGTAADKYLAVSTIKEVTSGDPSSKVEADSKFYYKVTKDDKNNYAVSIGVGTSDAIDAQHILYPEIASDSKWH